MTWSLKQIADWSGGNIVSEVLTSADSVGTDTRVDLTGKIFIALKGDTYDAHDYLDQASQKNASVLIVQRLDSKFEHLKEVVSIVLVQDTLQALQDFSHHHRQSLSTKVIGITGSNGKTTTKEFTAHILNSFKKTHYNYGSFNNHWGVPLTLLQITPNTVFAVVEMGMNHAGEITKLVQIAEPNVVVCTMVGTAHLEFFGSQVNIAKAKSEIYQESKPDTIRIFNQDQDLTFDMMYPVAKKFPASRMLSFSEKNDKADVYFKIDKMSMKSMTLSGSIAGREGSAVVPIFGKQNVVNLMAAASIAYACEMPADLIWKALPLCKTTWGRNQFIQTACGAEILFDGYNANPDSMSALLENIPLLNIVGKKIGVFGQMKELGKDSAEAHRNLGQKVGDSGFSDIFFIGEDYKFFAEGIAKSSFEGFCTIKSEFQISAGEKLQKILQPNDIILIKGSRGAATERFIEYCQPLNWEKNKKFFS